MKALSNTMISALRSSKPSSIGVMACTTRTGKALESRGLASPYYHLATDVVPHYQISDAGREHLALIERTESELRGPAPTLPDGVVVRSAGRRFGWWCATCQNPGSGFVHRTEEAAFRDGLKHTHAEAAEPQAERCRTEGDGLSIRTSLRTVHAEIICTCRI